MSHIGHGRLRDEEYRREFGDDMKHKPVLDAKITFMAVAGLGVAITPRLR